MCKLPWLRSLLFGGWLFISSASNYADVKWHRQPEIVFHRRFIDYTTIKSCSGFLREASVARRPLSLPASVCPSVNSRLFRADTHQVSSVKNVSNSAYLGLFMQGGQGQCFLFWHSSDSHGGWCRSCRSRYLVDRKVIVSHVVLCNAINYPCLRCTEHAIVPLLIGVDCILLTGILIKLHLTNNIFNWLAKLVWF